MLGEGQLPDVGFHQREIKEKPVFVTSSLTMGIVAVTLNAPFSAAAATFTAIGATLNDGQKVL
jgi:hypothetical protein